MYAHLSIYQCGAVLYGYCSTRVRTHRTFSEREHLLSSAARSSTRCGATNRHCAERGMDWGRFRLAEGRRHTYPCVCVCVRVCVCVCVCACVCVYT
jgi:hypothetical protein